MGFKHRRICPRWPMANSEVERANRSILKSIRATHSEVICPKPELYSFLRNYVNTRHATTQNNPAELLFARQLDFYNYQPKVLAMMTSEIKTLKLNKKLKRMLTDETMQQHVLLKLETECW